MYKKLKEYLHNIPFGPHWGKLLIADSLITVFAGIAAYAFSHGAAACVGDFLPLLGLLSIYLLCYLTGFVLMQTYNSFLQQQADNFRRAISAIAIGALIIVILHLCSGNTIFLLFRFRDLLLQIVFIMVGMNLLRMLVKIHFDIYKRRSTSTGAYGLSDIALLNMEMSTLLQRRPIEINTETIHREMLGKRILVTGAGGSIGSELVNLLAGYEPALLILIDQAETPLHDISMMMRRDHPTVPYIAIVTDVCHGRRMEHIFRKNRPQVIFHAAAYKHVPMMEDNAVESVLNNVSGTVKLADLAVRFDVDKFILISTDKAVNPTNIMGCSKRICEIYCQSLARDIERHGKCQFITTRFGNVLGSNGSVVPIFREQIRRGGPVYVTHPDIIRYFMLIPEACQLVLEAAVIGHGGEILAFDMGEPVRIADLAKKMIDISGRRDIKIGYTGLRKGEKLYEEVLMDDETILPTSHDKIKIAKVREYDFLTVSRQIKNLIEVACTYDAEKTVQLMGTIVPEFKH